MLFHMGSSDTDRSLRSTKKDYRALEVGPAVPLVKGKGFEGAIFLIQEMQQSSSHDPSLIFLALYCILSRSSWTGAGHTTL